MTREEYGGLAQLKGLARLVTWGRFGAFSFITVQNYHTGDTKTYYLIITAEISVLLLNYPNPLPPKSTLSKSSPLEMVH
jgi:hypothetical protein